LSQPRTLEWDLHPEGRNGIADGGYLLTQDSVMVGGIGRRESLSDENNLAPEAGGKAVST
jgi:hypothetical protein